jgi:hypothetical protein
VVHEANFTDSGGRQQAPARHPDRFRMYMSHPRLPPSAFSSLLLHDTKKWIHENCINGCLVELLSECILIEVDHFKGR